MILCAVLTTLGSLFLSASVQLETFPEYSQEVQTLLCLLDDS